MQGASRCIHNRRASGTVTGLNSAVWAVATLWRTYTPPPPLPPPPPPHSQPLSQTGSRAQQTVWRRGAVTSEGSDNTGRHGA